MNNLLDRLTEASYKEAELKQVIDFVWALDEKHPTLWTGIAKKLVITIMRDRMMEKR